MIVNYWQFAIHGTSFFLSPLCREFFTEGTLKTHWIINSASAQHLPRGVPVLSNAAIDWTTTSDNGQTVIRPALSYDAYENWSVKYLFKLKRLFPVNRKIACLTTWSYYLLVYHWLSLFPGIEPESCLSSKQMIYKSIHVSMAQLFLMRNQSNETNHHWLWLGEGWRWWIAKKWLKVLSDKLTRN